MATISDPGPCAETATTILNARAINSSLVLRYTYRSDIVGDVQISV